MATVNDETQPSIAAIVPMRHSSRGVSGKTSRHQGDKPLYRYIIDTLLEVPAISEVVIDTDSDLIVQEVEQRLPQVRIGRPPRPLRDEMYVMNDILLNTVTQVQTDYYLQTHSTNPLLKPETISQAIEM